jgi:hypothetical protein
MSEGEAKAVIKKIQATGQMRKLMADYFCELDRASRDGSQKIAWCTSVGPAELLLSLGFLVHYPTCWFITPINAAMSRIGCPGIPGNCRFR